MKLYIKNMVCDRCRMAVNNILQELNLNPLSITLGEVEFGDNDNQKLDSELLTTLEEKLEALGFELLNDKKQGVIEKIKGRCIEYVTLGDSPTKPKLSQYLSDALHHEYNYLSQLFSDVEGITVEQYFINQRIEKVKELLVYDELSLSEIAYQLGYSSTAHLSGQFKKITGLTPSHFRSLKDAKQRKSLDKL